MWSAISGLVGDVVGSIASSGGKLLGAGISAYANHREADLNREWQERLFRNRYQYSVADLKDAGLNPALAYGNLSASVPSGSQAAPTDFSKALDAAQYKLVKAQEALAKQQAVSNAKQADAKAELDLASAREVNARARTEEMRNAYYESLSPQEKLQLFNTREYGGSTVQQIRSVIGGLVGSLEHALNGSSQVSQYNNSIRLSRENANALLGVLQRNFDNPEKMTINIEGKTYHLTREQRLELFNELKKKVSH